MTSEGHSSCYFHPKQLVVGVCAFCLNDRLLILASKQPHSLSSPCSKPNATLSNILRFLTRRLQFLHPNPENSDHEASPCREDERLLSAESFISIKLERNGVGSWEKSKESKGLGGDLMESRYGGAWGRGRGHLFQLMRGWKKRPNKSGTVRHEESKVEGVKGRKGWIRSLTKRRMTARKAGER